MRKRHPPTSRTLLTAEAAAAALGISRRTLYSYASRGLIGVSGKSILGRGSLYDAADIERILSRKRRGRSQAAIAASTLRFGEPVLTSGLTSIENGRFSYRGRDAISLAEKGTAEEMAELLWSMSVLLKWRADCLLSSATESDFDVRCAGAIASAVALGKSDANPDVMQFEASHLLYLVAAAASGLFLPWPEGRLIHEGFADLWGVDAAGMDLLRRCLVLSVDHELSASTYAARIAASTGPPLEPASSQRSARSRGQCMEEQ